MKTFILASVLWLCLNLVSTACTKNPYELAKIIDNLLQDFDAPAMSSSIKDKFEWWPALLYRAVFLGNAVTTKRILDFFALEPIIDQSFAANVEKWFGESGIVNSTFAGRLPLNMAVTNGDIDIVTLLLEYKARPDAEDNKGYTALHLAAHFDRYDIACILLKHPQININIRSSQGSTSLSVACHRSNIAIVNFLLQMGADPNIPNIKGFTAMHRACYLGQETLINILIAHKADFNLTGIEVESPIMIALKQGHYSTVCILLQNGAKLKMPIKSYGLNGIQIHALCQALMDAEQTFVKFEVEDRIFLLENFPYAHILDLRLQTGDLVARLYNIFSLYSTTYFAMFLDQFSNNILEYLTFIYEQAMKFCEDRRKFLQALLQNAKKILYLSQNSCDFETMSTEKLASIAQELYIINPQRPEYVLIVGFEQIFKNIPLEDLQRKLTIGTTVYSLADPAPGCTALTSITNFSHGPSFQISGYVWPMGGLGQNLPPINPISMTECDKNHGPNHTVSTTAPTNVEKGQAPSSCRSRKRASVQITNRDLQLPRRSKRRKNH